MITLRQALDLKPGDEIRVSWAGRLTPATVYRVYGMGLDAIVGLRGCWYVRFDDVELGER
jgi:hypothetical protein